MLVHSSPLSTRAFILRGKILLHGSHNHVNFYTFLVFFLGLFYSSFFIEICVKIAKSEIDINNNQMSPHLVIGLSTWVLIP